MTTTPSILMGLDLGGTKIEAALVDPSKVERALCRMRLPTEAGLGYEHILNRIVELCREVEKQSGQPLPDVIGIGTPGTLDPTRQVIKGSNTQCLNGKPLRSDLEERLERKLIMANDANCFALAESRFGAARGHKVVFGMILGTGVGGGIVVGDEVLFGRHGIAGEWGQLILDPQGPPSAHGTRGSIESYICGPQLEKFYQSKSGNELPLPEIVTRARIGFDAAAEATLEHLLEYFSKAIACLVDVLDPDAFVIGGGVGNIDELYSPELRERIDRTIFTPKFEAEILRPSLGDSAGVFGAALLCSKNYVEPH